ncbi:MAG: hypothetical protein QGD94_04085, partial [Planctomycetia bacterium]|nr:hypothetical protein [Planctomycetia bacterium]
GHLHGKREAPRSGDGPPRPHRRRDGFLKTDACLLIAEKRALPLSGVLEERWRFRSEFRGAALPQGGGGVISSRS